MDLLREARTVIRSAENSLRGLMEKAIQLGRYGEVAQLAEMAQSLGRVLGEPLPAVGIPSADYSVPPPVITKGPGLTTPKATKSTKIRVAVADYPKFERDSNRLIKIGWSKREKAEYEHRVPRETARCVYLELAKVAATVFRMEELLPFNLPDGTEIPSYQTYLVLAWLRHISQIEKRANDSYQWVSEAVNDSSFGKAWDATRQRGVASRGRK